MRFAESVTKADNSSWAADMSASHFCTANSSDKSVFSSDIAYFAVSVFLCISDIICNIILSINDVIINILKNVEAAEKSLS